MRIRRPLIFTISCLLTEFIRCFTVSGLPDHVSSGEQVTLTWHWEHGDPKTILLAKTASSAPAAGQITPSIVVTGNVQTQGILSFTVVNPGAVSIVAYDLEQVDYSVIVNEVQPRPTPFVADPHRITLDGKGAPTTTSLSSPGSSSQGRTTQTSETSQSPPSQTPAHTAIATTAPSAHSGIGTGTGTGTGTPRTSNTSSLSGTPPSGQTSMTMTREGSVLPLTGANSSESRGQLGVTPSSGDDNPLNANPSQSGPSGGGPPGSKRPPSIGAIIGAILGTLAFIVIILVLIFCCRRRIRQQKWRPLRPGAFHGEKMIKRREEDQLERKGNEDRRASNSELLSAATSVPHIAGEVDDGTSTVSGVSSSRRDSEVTLERPDYTIYTISEIGSEADATSTIEPASTEIAHEYITPRTDRQMEIERKIFELQGQIIRLSDRSKSSDIVPSTPISIDLEMLKLREKVVRLRELQDEEWAREVTDEVPFEMLD
ncbi:hypothetical protein PQX77_000909 [Marasmius sp. AFHP31]|nr:hypothetical protein PQX77_000909 [Marasmius sp. AFHP31]